MASNILLRYVRQQNGDMPASRLRENLIAKGKARVNGEYGWFGYERVD